MLQYLPSLHIMEMKAVSTFQTKRSDESYTILSSMRAASLPPLIQALAIPMLAC